MVRAGRGGVSIDDFLEKSIVAIGWPQLGEVPEGLSKDDLYAKMHERYPNANSGQLAIYTSQVYRFINEISIDDWVLSYESSKRIYHLGVIKAAQKYDPEMIEDLPRYRNVEWLHEIDRDGLTQQTRNSLGAISTLFQISGDAFEEIMKASKGIQQSKEDYIQNDSEEIELESIKTQSKELIKDRIIKLDAYELQDLVAGILRAMGYKTQVSKPGADRGVDILASPDGFGFEQPRIVVECKHRKGISMGSQDIRSFLGGRHKDDKGLYVSTGGFTKDARYEAERATIPVTLMDLDQMVEAVIEHYENMDIEIKAMIPLSKVYWPA